MENRSNLLYFLKYRVIHLLFYLFLLFFSSSFEQMKIGSQQMWFTSASFEICMYVRNPPSEYFRALIKICFRIPLIYWNIYQQLQLFKCVWVYVYIGRDLWNKIIFFANLSKYNTYKYITFNHNVYDGNKLFTRMMFAKYRYAFSFWFYLKTVS